MKWTNCNNYHLPIGPDSQIHISGYIHRYGFKIRKYAQYRASGLNIHGAPDSRSNVLIQSGYQPWWPAGYWPISVQYIIAGLHKELAYLIYNVRGPCGPNKFIHIAFIRFILSHVLSAWKKIIMASQTHTLPSLPYAYDVSMSKPPSYLPLTCP